MRSLSTGSRSEARRLARLVGGDFERTLRQIEAGAPLSDLDVVGLRPKAQSSIPSVQRPKEKSISQAIALFRSDPAKSRTLKTDAHYGNLAEVVAGLWGPSRPISSIDREACRELLETLRWLPTNPAKRFPRLSPLQAARMAEERRLTSVLSPASVNGYMTKFSAVLNFATNEGWIDRNPARGLQVIDPVRKRDKRLPFSPDQLRLIFNAPLYTGCLDDWHGYAVPGPARPRRGRFWIPLIALFSGLRLNEACQLDVADIHHIDGVDCFYVTAGATEIGNDKRLKTASSERFVPVHPMLIEIGFMDFVSRRREDGDRKLFADLQRSSTGYYSDPFSKWFRRFLQRAGAARPKTCFHSFRHCYRDALREARIEHEVALALGGWSSGNGGDGGDVAANYGRGYRAQTLLSAIEKVAYPRLDLSHLIGRDLVDR